MKNFHTGGVASGAGDMTQGVDRIKQLFEVRAPLLPAIVSPFDGVVSFYEHNKLKYIRVLSDFQRKTYLLKPGYVVEVKKGESLTKGASYAVK
jgi:DNA-directed RNA polymerase subunit beta'